MVKQKIRISKIDASHRLRPIDPAHAEVIAASIAEVGLKQPIVVRVHPTQGPYEYELVIGAHRLHALQALLGWNELEVGREVAIHELDDDAAKLAEVDENLARHELNALDRAIFLAERKRLYLAINPDAGRGKASKIKGNEKGQTLAFFSRSFAKATAERVGLSKSAINLSISLAEKLDPEAVAALRGTALETNQSELFSLAILSPEHQRLVASVIREGKAKSTLKAKVVAGLEPERKQDDPQVGYLIAADYAVSKFTAASWKSFLAKHRLKRMDDDDSEFAKAPSKGGRK